MPVYELLFPKFLFPEKYVSDEVKQKRLTICEQCPRLNRATAQCMECLCFVKWKTDYVSEECDLKKW